MARGSGEAALHDHGGRRDGRAAAKGAERVPEVHGAKTQSYSEGLKLLSISYPLYTYMIDHKMI